MNTAIKAFAGNTPNWEFVDLAGVSRNHGICNCASGFFNTMGRSLDRQGDLFGSVHPNRTGYREMYQPKTVERVIRRFAIGRAIEIHQQQAAGN